MLGEIPPLFLETSIYSWASLWRKYVQWLVEVFEKRWWIYMMIMIQICSYSYILHRVKFWPVYPISRKFSALFLSTKVRMHKKRRSVGCCFLCWVFHFKLSIRLWFFQKIQLFPTQFCMYTNHYLCILRYEHWKLSHALLLLWHLNQLCKMFDQQLLRGEIDPKVYSSFSENLLLGPSREHEDVSFCSGSRPSHFFFELYHYEHQIIQASA